MVIEKAIENYLKTKTGLTALVQTRIFPDAIPETNQTWPAITYQLISGVDDHALSEDPDSTTARWQFTIVSKTAAERANVWNQLKSAFQDFSGIMGGAGGIQVHAVLQENRVDQYSPETKIYMRTVDFMFIYDEN